MYYPSLLGSLWSVGFIYILWILLYENWYVLKWELHIIDWGWGHDSQALALYERNSWCWLYRLFKQCICRIKSKRMISFASCQYKVSLLSTNSSISKKPESHIGCTFALQLQFSIINFLILSKIERPIFFSIAEVKVAVCYWIKSKSETFFMDGMKNQREHLENDQWLTKNQFWN